MHVYISEKSISVVYGFNDLITHLMGNKTANITHQSANSIYSVNSVNVKIIVCYKE